MEGSHDTTSSPMLTLDLDYNFSKKLSNCNKQEEFHENIMEENNDFEIKEVKDAFEVQKDDEDNKNDQNTESGVCIKIERDGSEEENDIQVCNKTDVTEVETDIQDKEEIDISEYLYVKIEEQGTPTGKRSLGDVSVDSNVGISKTGLTTRSRVNILSNDKVPHENVNLQDKMLPTSISVNDENEMFRQYLAKHASAIVPSTSLGTSDKRKVSNNRNKNCSANTTICRVCKFNCLTKDNLKRHLRTHTSAKIFICDLCGHRCSRKYHLGKHIQFKHTKERNFPCPACPYKFVTNSDLNKHLRKHTGEKPYVCDFCDYRCAKKFYLKSHVQYKHTKEKSFSCHMCLYQSVTKYNLDEHIRTHTGEKPYICNFCDYRCSCRANLNSHMRAKHPK